MKSTKARLRKKYFKLVASRLKNNEYISDFYLQKIKNEMVLFFDKKFWELRAWIYASELKETDFGKAVQAHYANVEAEFKAMSGNDPRQIYRLLEARSEGRIKREKKRKKKPAPPVRKLKNPEQFTIANAQFGRLFFEKVIGEHVFDHDGFKFFIHFKDNEWVVSEEETGCRVYAHRRYKKAVEIAKERIIQLGDGLQERQKEIKRKLAELKRQAESE